MTIDRKILALEYKSLRDAGVSPVAAYGRMQTWRAETIETLLSRAETHGLPGHVQDLVLSLRDESRALTCMLAKAVIR